MTIIKKSTLIYRIILLFSFIFLIGCSMGNTAKPLESNKWETYQTDRVSIHDPSITSTTDENGEEVFYVFGSHVAQAKTTDLLNWEVPHRTEYENMGDNILFSNTTETLDETFEWAGYNDADSAGGFNLWAPDVIWNEDFKWSNGDNGAFLMFYSASSTWRRSAITLLASKEIEGPYSYVDTILYSGFTSEDSVDGSDRNIHYENTHLPELISQGEISEFNENWVTTGGREYNADYAPNAIDPTPFYDEEGKLWLVYGSWSGGTYLLELNPETGTPIYPGEDNVTEDGRIIDRYFGVKISGGYHQSGEGPYILYDDETGLYNLWVTYGALQANGGYNMRLFQSKNVTGPYVDAQENSGIIENPDDQNSNYGIKLMGNWHFDNHDRRGYRASGHNSAIKTENGNLFLVFHTRFNEGTQEHEVRIHEMLNNNEGQPLPLPYEYRGELASKEDFHTSDIVGEYEFIDHGNDNSGEMIETERIYLEDNYTISGDVNGNWALTEESYLELTIDDEKYNGIITKQLDEQDEMKIVFSAFGEANNMIWGSSLN